MIKSIKQQAGVGLTELFLVIIVGAGILYFSILQYLSFKQDSDIMQVRYNVDTLFQAMGRYFQANCNISLDHPHPDTEVLSAYYPAKYFAVTLEDLRTNGYLTETLPDSPLVDYTTASLGYVMQFNQIQPLKERKIGLSPPGTGEAVIGQIILWQAQVSVLLKNPDTAPQYQHLLQANCLSQEESAGSNIIVTPCANAAPPASQIYAVFERQPSLPSEKANSTYWQTNPAVKQFTQMYTTDPILVLTGGTTPSTTQYYVCGS